MVSAKQHNHVFNHVALSIPDIEAAAKWYGDIFGFQRIRSDNVMVRAETPDAALFKIYPKHLNKVKVAYMTSGNGVGVEFFEFIDPPYKKPEVEFEFNRGSIYHFAITVVDAEDTLKRATAAGGKLLGEAVNVFGETAFYILDPWGNAIECLTASFEKLLSNRE